MRVSHDRGNLGPYFFKNKTGAHVTVDVAGYTSMVNDYVSKFEQFDRLFLMRRNLPGVVILQLTALP